MVQGIIWRCKKFCPYWFTWLISGFIKKYPS